MELREKLVFDRSEYFVDLSVWLILAISLYPWHACLRGLYSTCAAVVVAKIQIGCRLWMGGAEEPSPGVGGARFPFWANRFGFDKAPPCRLPTTPGAGERPMPSLMAASVGTVGRLHLPIDGRGTVAGEEDVVVVPARRRCPVVLWWSTGHDACFPPSGFGFRGCHLGNPMVVVLRQIGGDRRWRGGRSGLLAQRLPFPRHPIATAQLCGSQKNQPTAQRVRGCSGDAVLHGRGSLWGMSAQGGCAYKNKPVSGLVFWVSLFAKTRIGVRG